MAESSGNKASPTGDTPVIDARNPDSDPARTGALVLADGTVFRGFGLGAKGAAVGEVCFVTSMTGYQETLTDPSFAGQIVTFTFPHIGIVGANPEDMETSVPASRGAIMRMDPTDPSNFRSAEHIDSWLTRMNLVGLAGLDTRRLTRRIRDMGAPTGVVINGGDAAPDIQDAVVEAKGWPGLEGMDLAKAVTCSEAYSWTQTVWALGEGYGAQTAPKRKVVAIDYGAKHNILRHLAERDCDVEVVPATATAEDILARKPDGVFLSNGPGDPAATAEYAVPCLQALIRPVCRSSAFALATSFCPWRSGAQTDKMDIGHRGANHPVKELATGKVEITSQNHGFAVMRDSLPDGVIETHSSLFDSSVEGIAVQGKPIFSVQYHPEASPGPHDSRHLFDRFIEAIDQHA